MAEVTGAGAPSPSGQNARPLMLSAHVEELLQVFVGARAGSRRSRIRTIQNVPSRHGVHLPHDSCW